MTDLNAFVPPGSDLTLVDGGFINDRGEIAGVAVRPDGSTHAVLLVPCGEGSDGCMDAAESTNNSLATVSPDPMNPTRKLTTREIMSEIHNTRHRLYLGAQIWGRK